MAFTDDFNRVNAGDLGANWTNIDAGWAISTNTAEGGSATPNLAKYTGGAFANDQYAQCTLVTLNGAADEGVGPAVRVGAADAYFVQAGPVDTRLYKRVGGSYTQLVDPPAAAAAPGDLIRLEVSGTALTVKKNGATIITATDGDLTSGNAGLWASPAGNFVDDWEGGDLTAPVIKTPYVPYQQQQPILAQ